MKIAFCSYTGKATRVLTQNLISQKSLKKQDSVSTIHSLIYSPMVDAKEQIIGWELKDSVKYDLIIIDEASMVSKEIWQDLLSFNIPIIAVGDHGQLPPIKGKFNLMEKPQIKLEKIHRQAAGNPIIEWSIQARKEGNIPLETLRTPKGTVRKIDKNDIDAQSDIEELLTNYTDDAMILSGYNNTRTRLNEFIRKSLGFESPIPQINDRVICLRNNHITGIYNGMLGTISKITEENEDWYFAEIQFDDEMSTYKGLISVNQFGNSESLNFTDKRSKIMTGDLFDFGYALTVHKSQGSQARRVILFEERFKQMNDEMWRKWLYTGVTRAMEELYVIGE